MTFAHRCRGLLRRGYWLKTLLVRKAIFAVGIWALNGTIASGDLRSQSHYLVYPFRPPYRGQVSQQLVVPKTILTFNFLNGGYPNTGVLPLNGALYGGVVDGFANATGGLFVLTPSRIDRNYWMWSWLTEAAAYTAPLIASGGVLYGSSSSGGAFDAGFVFSVTPNGQLNDLFDFNFAHLDDGCLPYSSVLVSAHVLYGTTGSCGSGSGGTIFALTPPQVTIGSSPGQWNLVTLHSFAREPDGSGPSAITSYNGTIVGTTESGGTHNTGTVFSINPDGSNYQIIYNFVGQGGPSGGLITLGNSLVGTAALEGFYGNVFELTPTFGGGWSYASLYTFAGGTDGALPRGLLNYQGALYGTTFNGGVNNLCADGVGCGTIFKLTPPREGEGPGWHEMQLVTFTGGADGQFPVGPLAPFGGLLYGATERGGGYGYGTVFSINTTGFVPAPQTRRR